MTSNRLRMAGSGVAFAVGLFGLLILPAVSHDAAWGGDGLDHAEAVSEPELDAVRGGFEMGGLEISFGIEQATYINGLLQVTTELRVPDLGLNLGSTEHPATLIQNGPGNAVSLESLPPGVLAVIQNTLDQQLIQHVTVIDLNVTSLGLFREQLLQSLLHVPF